MTMTRTRELKAWQGGVLASVGTVAVAAAIAVSSAHAAGTPASPQVWMSAVCTSLKSLEYDAAATVATEPRATAGARMQLLAQLVRVGSDANTLVEATSRPLPGAPQGASIAASLHSGGVAFRGVLNAGQALVRRAAIAQLQAKAATLTAQLRTRSIALGTTFIHLGQRFPSAQLDATIDQTPTCALVHG